MAGYVQSNFSEQHVIAIGDYRAEWMVESMLDGTDNFDY